MRFLILSTLFVAGAASATIQPPSPMARSERARAATMAQQFEEYPYNGEFIFARVYYDIGIRSFRGWGPVGASNGPPWSHDYPIAEQNLTKIVRELTFARAFTESGNILKLDDPELMKFPIAYMSEPGFWRPNDKEVAALRAYLLKGGFIIFDDFGEPRDPAHLNHLVAQMRRVLPELSFVPLETGDPIFDSFFQVDLETLAFPGFYRGDRIEFWGIFEDDDRSKRLLAVAGNYGDLGDFWEYSATGMFPVDLSNDAYKVGINYIIYGMTR